MFTTFIRRSLLAALIAFPAMFGAFATTAHAATGPWTWTDASSLVSIRTNRPVWAMAYAKPYWYFTDGQDLTASGHVWRTDGKASNDISSEIRATGLTRVDGITSDGKTVLFVKNVLGQNVTKQVLAFDGTSYKGMTPDASQNIVGAGADGISAVAANGANTLFITAATTNAPRFVLITDTSGTRTIELPTALRSAYLKNAKIAWTGSSWMILDGKNVYRVNGDSFESYGQTRDYFTSIASDGNGNVLLGGAISTNTSDSPSFPLTAKLVSVFETGTGAQTTMAAANGTSSWTWIEPTLTTLRRDQTTSYNVGAWNEGGIKKVEIFVNWNLRQTCDFGTGAKGNQNCSVKLVGSDYAADSTISMIAKITNANDAVTWTKFTSLPVKEAVLALASNTYVNSTASGITTYTWLEPNLSSLSPNGYVTLKSQANANDGLNRIELIVDGKVRKLCDFSRAYGTQDCEVSLSGIDFTLGSLVPVYSQATGTYGKIATSALRTIDVRDNLQYAGAHPATIATWMSPNVDTIQIGQEATYFAQAQDTDGLDRIDILVDGKTVKTSSYANAYDTREISIPVSQILYPNRDSVGITTRAVDTKGNITLSDTRSFTILR